MKQNILFVMNTLKIGGAEKQTIDIINGLDKSKYTISITCFDNDTSLTSYIDNKDQIEIQCINKTNKLDKNIIITLVKQLMAQKPEYIVAVNQYPLLYVAALIYFVSPHSKIVHINHTTVFPSKYLETIVKMIVVRIMKRIYANIFVCNSQRDYWINNYKMHANNLTVIHNGIDIHKFIEKHIKPTRNELRKSLNIDLDDIVIVLCANMRPEKRHLDLITALCFLRQKGYSAKLLLVGDGTQRQQIDQFIQSQNMTEHVMIVGQKSDVRPYLSASDVFVIASDSETFSLAVLEAMAMGKAIIASDVGGIREQVIDGYNGYIFPPRNIMKLTECLERIIFSDGFQAMGNNSRKIVEDHYALSIMNDNYAQVFI